MNDLSLLWNIAVNFRSDSIDTNLINNLHSGIDKICIHCLSKMTEYVHKIKIVPYFVLNTICIISVVSLVHRKAWVGVGKYSLP